jgi:DNA topoisomerase-2
MDHKLRFPTFKEHVKNRSMWKGSNVCAEMEYWMINSETGKFERGIGNISEALLKCADEIIVNACDQYVRAINIPQNQGGPVTLIEIKFNVSTGEITITNNGQGFDVYNNHPDLPPDMYTVEGVITRERSGTNFDDIYDQSTSDASDRVTGGINGLGMKLIILDSDKFTIETVDKARETYYYQEVYNSMDDVHSPVVVNLKNAQACKEHQLSMFQKKPHTTISFIPDYANLCRAVQNRKNPKWITSSENLAAFQKIIEFRSYQLATFVNSIKYRYEGKERIEYKSRCKVYFNGTLLPITGTKDLATMLAPCSSAISCMIESEDNSVRFPWSITAGLTAGVKCNNINILNGVHLIDGGSHINYLMSQILAFVNKKTVSTLIKGTTAKKDATTSDSGKAKVGPITEAKLQGMMFIVDSIQIPTPQFTSQSKTSIKLGTKDLNTFKKTYAIPEDFLNKIWKLLKDEIAITILEKEITSENKKDAEAKRQKIRKYEKAHRAGNHKELDKLMLFVPEGDSACKPIRDIISSKETPLSSQYCGTYNIQGVPPNALKHTNPPVIRGGIPIIAKDKILSENIAFNGLIAALGLDYKKQYYYGEAEKYDALYAETREPKWKQLATRERTLRKAGDDEFATLNYGCIITATDQDLDGIGQICSLILVEFLCFWPELIKRGFVKKLVTPLIRVYTNNANGDVLRFYSQDEYNAWIAREFGEESNLPAKYEVNHYKGMATHTEEEVIYDIGVNILDNIYTFTIDDATKYTLNLAYGSDANPRKEFLQSPIEDEYDPEDQEQHLVKCSEHFIIETKAYQLDFAARKLKHAIDGFIPSQRKAFAGVRKAARSKNAKMKVYQLTGEVTKSFHYQHGDTSMNDTIIKMAQNFTGSCNLPMLMAISNGFGDRRTGREETGSPRYILTKYNKRIADAMFPPEDDWLLDYVYEDGEQAEPANYVPVLPYSILETTTTVSVGWNIECWGRDPFVVCESVKRMIKLGYGEPGSVVKPTSLVGKVWLPDDMKINVCMYSPSVSKPTEVCFGTYEVNKAKDEVRVTQLPIKTWSYPYKCMLEGIKPDTKGESAMGGAKELVKSVYDDTGNDKNDILIKLVPGGCEAIESQYGFEGTDPYEDYLELRKQMHCRLNMIADGGYVKEFTTYESVIEYWYPKRKQLYVERLNRKTLLLECRIDYWKNVLRFIYADAADPVNPPPGVEPINIDKDFSEEERKAVLSNAHYKKFNKTILFNPQYLRFEVLREHVYDIGASYKYIDDITIGEKSKTSIAKLVQKIQDLEDELEEYKRTTWKDLWLKEIDALEAIIREGIKTKWLFETKQHFFKKAQAKK